MEIGESGLQRQNADEQERRPIHAGHDSATLHVMHRRIHDAAREIRKRQTEQTAREQGNQSGAKARPVRPEVAEQLQRLPEGFPIQLRLGEFDSGLVIA